MHLLTLNQTVRSSERFKPWLEVVAHIERVVLIIIFENLAKKMQDFQDLSKKLQDFQNIAKKLQDFQNLAKNFI